MSKLGFGLMRLPLTDARNASDIDLEQTSRMVDAFLEAGFTYFDTAYFYHQRASERIARRALVERHPRDSFTLATKLPVSFLKSPEHQQEVFREQLEKCGVEYFDYYLLHALSEKFYEKALDYGSFDFISRLKSEGRVKRIGFSFHDRAQVLDRILTEHPEVDFVQLQLNYLDWENGGIQSRLCWETARKHGKPIVVMEPVKGGALAKLPPEAEEILRRLRPDDRPWAWALRFAAGLEGVVVVLSGMSDLTQITGNAALFTDLEPISQQERQALAQVAELLGRRAKIPCTGCRYCVEGCPKSIPIPDVFALFNQDMEQEKSHWAENDLRYQELTQNKGIARDCVECRHCEDVCPQHIDVVKRLKDVNWRFDR